MQAGTRFGGIPAVPPHHAAFRARRVRIVKWIATSVTVLAAAIAIVLVAIATVGFAIT
jgi:hypothetical protein